MFDLLLVNFPTSVETVCYAWISSGSMTKTKGTVPMMKSSVDLSLVEPLAATNRCLTAKELSVVLIRRMVNRQGEYLE